MRVSDDGNKEGERKMANAIRWSVEKFLPLYLEAVQNGLTKEEFADQIGVKPLTVYQRVVKLRQDARLKNLPHLKGEDRPSVADKAAAIFAQFADVEVEPVADAG